LRKSLDFLYDAAGYLAAFFMVGLLLMVLASVLGRLLDFQLRGSDAYAGYCMAAASFLALAHTLKRGEHIRVTLLLERFGERIARALDLWCHLAGSFFCAVLAVYSVRLAWQSCKFNDISQGNDATRCGFRRSAWRSAPSCYSSRCSTTSCASSPRAVPIAGGAEPKHIE
jgi:TRAP-type C4-dicarboxylate transport system permease small subunit